MAQCDLGAIESLLFEQGSYLSYGMYRTKLTEYGKLPSGYFSAYASCSASLEGSPYPCDNGLRPLNIRDVWASSCDGARFTQPNDKAAFCANVFDSSGTRRNPISCGGTDPIPFQYSSQQEGLTEAQEQAQALADELGGITDEEVAEKRRKVITAAIIIFILILAVYFLWTL